MGFNVDRIRMHVQPAEFSCWAPTPESFHAPMRFGDLVLGDYAAWLRGYTGDELATITRTVQALLERYPTSTSRLRERAAGLPALPGRIRKHADSARDEASALAALERIEQGIQRARAIAAEVRLAVIDGEFR
jgi:hypothetical protein